MEQYLVFTSENGDPVFRAKKLMIVSNIKEKQEEVVEEFSMFDDWMQRYEYMIELGKSLPLIDEKYKVDENLIKGCQSKVWVHAELQGDRLVFTADSDAIITKGIVAILIRVFQINIPQRSWRQILNS
jgi:cysteine desulfuration protein SufE